MYILPPSISKKIEGYRWQSFTPPAAGKSRRFRGLICHRRSQSRKKRIELKGSGPHGGKTIVAGAKDRATNEVSAKVLREATTASLQGFIDARTRSDAVIYTDDYNAYTKLKNKHESVTHTAGEYVRGDVHTQGIESFWCMLKRAHMGTFHKMSPKHTDRYVQEFTGRQNVRELDTIVQMQIVVAGMADKRLKYKELIASNGLSSAARS